MNRYATVAILALATFALAANSAPTQDNGSKSDAEETAAVRAKGLDAYVDFCIQSRDYVYGDLKKKTDEAASEGFHFLAETADEIGKHALSAQQEAASRIANQLANPKAEVEGEDEIAAAQRQIASQSAPGGLLTGIRATLAAGSAAIINIVGEKVEQFKKFTTKEQFTVLAAAGCDKIAGYEDTLKEQFEEYKKANDLDMEVKMSSVPCATSTMIIQAEGVCGFIKSTYEPLVKIFTAGSA